MPETKHTREFRLPAGGHTLFRIGGVAVSVDVVQADPWGATVRIEWDETSPLNLPEALYKRSEN